MVHLYKLIKDCNKICSSLSAKEQDYAGSNIINQDIIFLQVMYYNKLPIAFICIKEPHVKDERVNEVYTILAVHPKYRHKKLATSLVQQAIKWFIDSSYDQLIYTVDIDNIASENLAKSCGFTYGWPKDDGKRNAYLITNPSKLKIDNTIKTASIKDNLDKDTFTHSYVNMDDERDRPFLIVDDKLIVGTPNQIHSELQMAYMQEYSNDIKYAVYGHVIDNVAMIDYAIDDDNAMDWSTVISLLKANFDKVYDMSTNNGEFIFNRIAKNI